MAQLNASVFFAHEDEAQVLVSSDASDEEEARFWETCLFSLFAARQIANLGGDWVAGSLASTLAAIDVAQPLVWGREALGDLRLVPPYRRATENQGFRAEFRPKKRAFFKMKVVGFGALGKGTGYYAPVSVIALLVSLLEHREDDAEYQRALAHSARLVGTAGDSISVRSQAPIAMDAALEAWAAAFAEIDAPELAGESSLVADTPDLLDRSDAIPHLDAQSVEPMGAVVVLSSEEQVPLEFRVVAVQDPVLLHPAVYRAERGYRYLEIQVELQAPPSNEETANGLLNATLVDDAGELHPMAGTPDLDYSLAALEPGESTSVSMVFQLEEERRPSRVAVSFDESEFAALWDLGSRGAAEPLLEGDSIGQSGPQDLVDRGTDAIDKIQRLAQLRADGILTEEEFQAKKTELLRRV